MAHVLLDRDAVHCLRKFGLIDDVLRAAELKCVMTSYATRHELSDIDVEVRSWEAQGLLAVVAVSKRDKAFGDYRAVQTEDHVHKGEAEAIAWAVHHETSRCLFVSKDKAARAAATGRKVEAIDAFGLMAVLVALAVVGVERLEAALLDWTDPARGFCRPADFVSARGTLAARGAETARILAVLRGP